MKIHLMRSWVILFTCFLLFSCGSSTTNEEADSDGVVDDAYYVCDGIFAYETPIAVSDSVFVEIQDFLIGDLVLASANGVLWENKAVHFASGVEPGQSLEMVTVNYTKASGQPEDIVASPDSCFLLTDGSLAYASSLTTTDQIQMANGQAAAVNSVTVGSCDAGVFKIRVSETIAEDEPGQYLNANGLVTTEYLFQQW